MRNYIHEDKLPAVLVGKQFMVYEADLERLLVKRVGSVEPTAPAANVSQDLGDYIKALVDTFPVLTADQKTELGRLLSPAA